MVGRLRSAAFGYTVGRTVGTTYLPAGIAEGTPIEVDVFADRLAGEVAADVLVDPTGEQDARLGVPRPPSSMSSNSRLSRALEARAQRSSAQPQKS